MLNGQQIAGCARLTTDQVNLVRCLVLGLATKRLLDFGHEFLEFTHFGDDDLVVWVKEIGVMNTICLFRSNIERLIAWSCGEKSRRWTSRCLQNTGNAVYVAMEQQFSWPKSG